MEKKELLSKYNEKKSEIKKRLQDFKNLSENEHIHEAIFCLLTPQSQAKKCWEAVVQIQKFFSPELWDAQRNRSFSDMKEISQESLNKNLISSCLSTKTRFHNNKTKYILKLRNNWQEIKQKIQDETKNNNIIQLRNWLADNILGLGMKEASHFLRNIGKSNNQIAILDRHILRNLKELKIIKDIPTLNKKNYLILEDKFKSFSKKINIPIDELDLLFWSEENGSIFK